MELRRYWEVFWRRKWIFVYTFGGIVILTLIWAFSSTPIYKATSKIIIRSQDRNNLVSTVPSQMGKLNLLTSGKEMNTVVEMIEHKDSLTRVIEDLNLQKKGGKPYTYKEIIDPNFIGIITGKIGIKVKQIQDTDVFEISGLSINPALAVNMSNKLTSNFLKFMEGLNREEIAAVIALLEKECSRLKSMVETADDSINEYKVNNMAINLDDMTSSLISQFISIELSLAKLTVEKKEGHPDIKTALGQIAFIKKELKEISGRQVQLTKLQRINTAMLNLYTSLLSDLEKAKVLRAMSITNATVLERAEIPKDYERYYRYFPKKKQMLLLALAIGGFLGIVSVFFTEYIDDTMKHPDDIRSWTGQKVLASIPLLPKDAKLFPPDESITQIFKAVGDLGLSIKMKAAVKEGKEFPRILTVTSYGDGEGKSLVSANLALLLSNIGFKTLLVDFNMRQPFLSMLYGKSSEKGFADFVIAMRGDTASVSPEFKLLKGNLYFLPTGSVSDSNLAAVINSPKFRDLLKIAESEFDVIIFDASPLNKGVEPVFIAKESDGTILVIEAGKYQLENIRQAIDRLKEADVNIIGAVLNKFEGKC